jgi:hypothetical protein
MLKRRTLRRGEGAVIPSRTEAEIREVEINVEVKFFVPDGVGRVVHGLGVLPSVRRLGDAKGDVWVWRIHWK